MKHVTVEHTVKNATAMCELLHQLFEAQAVRRPDHPAVECNGEIWTYTQLNQRADQVSRMLRADGIGAGSLVGLFMMKSCELFAAMLGILKSGAGYVPIDPKFPVPRINSIVDDAGIKIILTDQTLAPLIANSAVRCVLPSEFDGSIGSQISHVAVTPNDVCYVIYTSGSTGRPKGVAIEHRNAVNFAQAFHDVYKITDNDRIYQGFSVAFDASVEEIWAAFSLGGTLVVPPEDIARSTFDAAQFINDHHISYFSTVPSFLALMTPPLPSLKTLVLGGEVCTSQLIAKWARDDLRILNTYGPTEATVVTTAFECVAGQEVTIGSALPGYETHVLDDDLKPVNTGELGELYIGGASVARGYLNRPELTEAKFVTIGKTGSANRLYRTNDLVRTLDNGQLQFVGRTDTQVKIRGFRVELSEIETVLCEFQDIRQAAATTVECDGIKEIAVFVLCSNSLDTLKRNELVSLLQSRVPEYMIPKYLDVVSAFPTMASGKIDRQALPVPSSLLRQPTTKIAHAETETQRRFVEIWKQILQIPAVSIDDDFFTDLHGHSLLAARVVSELRRTLGGSDVSVRDIYQKRTIRKIAATIEEDDGDAIAPTSPTPGNRQSLQRASDFAPLPRFRFFCVGLQILGLFAFYGLAVAPFMGAVLLVLLVLDGSMAWETAAELATISGFAVWPSWLLLSIALKWIVIGRFKPGRYPVWSFYYFRWWLVTRFQTFSWSGMFVDTPLMNIYYRAMGAKIGRDCTIGTAHCGAFDLISIGEGSSVGAETHLLGYKVENGWLEFGPVEIGKDCFVGTHCALGLNVQLADNSQLEDLSILADSGRIASGESWRGSPAEHSSRTKACERLRHGRLANLSFGLIHLLLIYAMGYLLMWSTLPAIAIVAGSLYFGGPIAGFLSSLAAVPISILWYLKIVVATKRLFIGSLKPGVYSTRSLTFLRYWFFRYLLNNTRVIALPLYATLFFPRFLRALGAKIGRGVEISTVSQAIPDLLEIGDGSFLADGCIVGGHKIEGGRIELSTNRIGRRTFVGNSAFVPAGLGLADENLVGVLSTPPLNASCTLENTRWLGSPGFLLPNTQKISCFSTKKTFEPGIATVSARSTIDLLRVGLPGMVSMAFAAVFCAEVVISYRTLTAVATVLLTPVFAFATTLLTLLAVAALRHLFMPRFSPVVKPLWCSYVWLNEVVNALYEAVAAPLLAPMLGTPLAAWFLRVIGCRVGKWVFLETTLFSEFDLVSIGDRAALNLGSTIQTHLFEDRIMKSDLIRIGNYCSVGNLAVVLYDTQMEPGAVLEPLSVLMKGELLPSWTRWQGIPSQPAEAHKIQQDRQRRKLAAARSTAQARALKRNIWRASTSAIGIQAGLGTRGLGDKNRLPDWAKRARDAV